jgi:hypothetical protein
MKFRPEADNDRNEGIPSAEPGEYTMRISAWIEDRQTKNGTKDLVEFVGEIPYDGEIVMVGTTMWISHPENGKKGNLWKYRQLAEALGEDAVAEYRSKDADGFSMFNPIDWKDRAVIVEVGGTASRKSSDANSSLRSGRRRDSGPRKTGTSPTTRSQPRSRRLGSARRLRRRTSVLRSPTTTSRSERRPMQHLHRVTDPWTSKAAADSVKMKIAGLERMIVETIAEQGPQTSGEIQHELEQAGKIAATTRIHKRMAGLIRQGRISAIGIRRDPFSGRMATLYAAC